MKFLLLSLSSQGKVLKTHLNSSQHTQTQDPKELCVSSGGSTVM